MCFFHHDVAEFLSRQTSSRRQSSLWQARLPVPWRSVRNQQFHCSDHRLHSLHCGNSNTAQPTRDLEYQSLSNVFRVLMKTEIFIYRKQKSDSWFLCLLNSDAFPHFAFKSVWSYQEALGIARKIRLVRHNFLCFEFPVRHAAREIIFTQRAAQPHVANFTHPIVEHALL